MKHKEHILIGLPYLLPSSVSLLVEKNTVIGTEFTPPWLVLLLAISCYQHPPFFKKCIVSA